MPRVYHHCSYFNAEWLLNHVGCLTIQTLYLHSNRLLLNQELR